MMYFLCILLISFASIYWSMHNVFYSSVVLQDILRDTADHDIGHAIAHFFNCLFGDGQTASGKGVGNSNSQFKNQKKVNTVNLSWLSVNLIL